MAAAKAGDLTLGNYLKIVSKGSVYNNLSEDSPIWDYVKKIKKGPEEGRELRYLLRTAYGSAAAAFVPVNGGAYPTSSQATISEGTANYKDFALTVEVERTLIAKAISDLVQPLVRSPVELLQLLLRLLIVQKVSLVGSKSETMFRLLILTEQSGQLLVDLGLMLTVKWFLLTVEQLQRFLSLTQLLTYQWVLQQ